MSLLLVTTIGDEGQGKRRRMRQRYTLWKTWQYRHGQGTWCHAATLREGAVTAWELWVVRPRTDAETEELQRSLEREEEWHRKLEARAQGQCSVEAEKLSREGRQSATT